MINDTINNCGAKQALKAVVVGRVEAWGGSKRKKGDYHSDGWININDKYEQPYKQKFKLNFHPLDHNPFPQSLSI